MSRQTVKLANASLAESIGAPVAASVAMIGARSLVGERLLPLLAQQGRSVLALSRRVNSPAKPPETGEPRWQALAELD